MSNDRKASELLSKSFHQHLDDDEQLQLETNLASSDETAKFARLSRLIQDSVADVVSATQQGDPTVEVGLSDDAKRRLKDSVRKAQRESVLGTLESEVIPVERGTSFQPQPGDTRFTQTRFTLLREIGRGGLGTVWLARDEDLRRTVAVKEMHPDKAESPKHLQRFKREATITGFLEHPNVVPLYMYGVNPETGKPFYAMRFLGKQTLSDAIETFHARREAGQSKSIELHRLLTVFLDVCQAIAYAHSRGVVHRDLKPENVALDNFGQVVVLDWGIAKVLSDGELAIQCSLSQFDSDDSMLTKTLAGEVVGTPLYMAPEQAAGDLDAVDERTDVYGLGAVLFSILTGYAPHERTSEDKSESSIRDLLKAIQESNPPSPRDINPCVPRDLEEICVRALSPQRLARHTSAQELANDVEQWMAGQQEKQQHYEAVRLEGYNLRNQLSSCIRDLGTNVRFMSTLPPIQGLIDTAADRDEEGEGVWRTRLSTIFRGLLKSNPDFTSVAYCRLVDGEIHELVRVEKPTVESEARAVPKSRLAVSPLREFAERVIGQKPDEVHVAIRDEEENSKRKRSIMRVEAGVPVFDNEEEPFGMVTIESDFDRLLAAHVNQRSRVSQEVLIVDENELVLLEDSARAHGSVGRKAEEIVSSWSEIKSELDLNNDYVDSQREVYATRIDLVPGVSSLDLVLRAN